MPPIDCGFIVVKVVDVTLHLFIVKHDYVILIMSC